jgi:cobalt-zinc-cadmium efflux system membrane fusion protein
MTFLSLRRASSLRSRLRSRAKPRASTYASLLALAALLADGCAQPTPPKPTAAYQVGGNVVSVLRDTPIRFEIAVAASGPALPLSPVTARVTTVDALTSPSFAPLSGRVVESKVRLGDHVQKGQPLVQIRAADLAALEHDVQAAKLAVQTDAARVERMRALVDSRAGSENDLLVAQSELSQAHLAQKAAEARMSSLQVKRSDDTAYWILAARGGTVVQLDATPGLQVGPEHGTPIVTISDLAEVLVVGDVPQRDAIDLSVGTAAQIYPAGPSSDPIVGAIEAISEVVDAERQTVPVRVRVDNAARKLRPNSFVDLSLASTHARTTVLVPTVAVVRDGPDAVVFVQRAAGQFERRAVVLGRQDHEQVEISAGLRPGEHVVTTSALLLLNAIDIKA